MNKIQNQNRTCFAGAWTNYGFHEDGCTSGLLCAVSLGAECPFTVSLNGGYVTNRETLPVPEYLKDKVQRYVPAKPKYSPERVKETPGMGLPILLITTFVLVLGIFWAAI